MIKISTDLSRFKFVFAICMTAASLMGFAVSVLAAKGELTDLPGHEAEVKAPFKITLGKAELVEVEGEVSDVLIANPSIIDVTAIQANRLYIVGLEVGDTNIIALDENGDIVKRLDIHVTYDLQAIQSLVNDLFPTENVRVRSLHDQVVLTGTVSSPEASSKISNVVGHYIGDVQDDSASVDELVSNLLEVRGEQQVLLKVRIIEASRSVSRELGIDTNFNDPNELATTTLFGATPSNNVIDRIDSVAIGGGAGLSLSSPATGVARLLADTGIRGLGDMGIFIEALEEEGLVNTLAEPNLTAVSGEQAGFLAGGEFPVPSGLDNVGNVMIEYREFGVSLNFLPVVVSQDRIILQLNTEVSALDFDNAVTLSGVIVPGLNTRRADTTVEIPSGASLMIAGLLQSDAIKSMSGLPGVSKAPVIGDLISSDGFSREETELIVLVTPYLVEPYEETELAEEVPPIKRAQSNPLASAFASNIRRSYKIKDDDDVFDEDGSFGYLLD